MKNSLKCSLLLLSLAVGAGAADKPKDMEALQGKWNGISMEVNGEKIPVDQIKGKGWSFKGNQVTFDDPDSPGLAIFKIDSTRTPKEIDIMDGAGENKKTLLGIYRLEGKRLTVCLRFPDAPEKGRPKEFAAPAESKAGLLVFERAEK